MECSELDVYINAMITELVDFGSGWKEYEPRHIEAPTLILTIEGRFCGTEPRL